MSTSQAIAETQGRLAELRNRERAERMDQLKIQLAHAKATVRSAGTQYQKLHAEVLTGCRLQRLRRPLPEVAGRRPKHIAAGALPDYEGCAAN